MQVKQQREALGLSQRQLARLSNVHRFKICVYEQGNGSVTPEELGRIQAALQAEAQRLGGVAKTIGQETAGGGVAR